MGFDNIACMNVAIATAPYPRTLEQGLHWVETYVREAAAAHADVICFPESYLPGYPIEEEERENCSAAQLQAALARACEIASLNAVSIILPMDWHADGAFLNVAHVISKTGELLGYQTKNQLDPSEDKIWQPGSSRHVFELDGVKFAISICHEGFRYPETVRWAARQGVKIVFHPNYTGSNIQGPRLREWGHRDNPYYEKAQMLRAMENTIYFAPCNYAFQYPESASSVIAPDGTCLVHQAYGQPGIVICAHRYRKSYRIAGQSAQSASLHLTIV